MTRLYSQLRTGWKNRFLFERRRGGKDQRDGRTEHANHCHLQDLE